MDALSSLPSLQNGRVNNAFDMKTGKKLSSLHDLSNNQAIVGTYNDAFIQADYLPIKQSLVHKKKDEVIYLIKE